MPRRKKRDLSAHLDALQRKALEAIALDPNEHPDTVQDALRRLAAPSRRELTKLVEDTIPTLQGDVLAAIGQLLRGEAVLVRPHAAPSCEPAEDTGNTEPESAISPAAACPIAPTSPINESSEPASTAPVDPAPETFERLPDHLVYGLRPGTKDWEESKRRNGFQDVTPGASGGSGWDRICLARRHTR